ncbi:MAG TPA: endonuclease, partial [Spirochaetota bacterium]|nr:endonuclease [Spirochaetota bacterium]
ATDGKVNGMRSNYPHGNVATATWTSLNGGKLGAGTSTQGYTGTCFEPRADAKGDIARIYMYFAIRYYGDSRCTAWASMGAGAKLVSWSQTLYRSWSAADPVSSKEKTRNEAIYTIQKNRNPLIDYPVIATLIDFTL